MTPGAGQPARQLAPPGDYRSVLLEDARLGLSSRPRRLPPKYFYDEAGCRLFDRITRLPEYYLTRTETALLEAEAGGLIDSVRPDELLEIGGGLSRKTRLLLSAMGRCGGKRYVSVDFSEEALARTAATLAGDFPWLTVRGVVADFERHLGLIPPADRRLVALLGSTVGNLNEASRARLFREVRRLLGASGFFLLGVDLVKEAAVLQAAYDDEQGVTAEFNRNVLAVVNRELDADFDPAGFEHVARWVPAKSRMEMWLRSTQPVTVHVAALGLDVAFEQGEEMLTEISCKFTRRGLEPELRAAGLAVERWITDDAGAFALVLARPALSNASRLDSPPSPTDH